MPNGSIHQRAHRRVFDPVIDPLLIRWAAQQHSGPEDLAKRIGIPADQFHQWLREHPELKTAVAEGQRTANAKVVEALFQRATGYEYENTDAQIEDDGKGTKKRKKKIMQRHMPSEVRAAIYWLKNRLPQEWRDNPPAPPKQEIIARIRPITKADG